MIKNLDSQTDLSGFYIVYNGSTNLEKPGWRGLSHLMEHLVFKSVDHLQEEFDRDGLDYNAYTSSNNIVFYLTGLDEKVNKWKNTFLELLLKFQVTEEGFINERKIVLEEYMDYFNDQTYSHSMNLSRKLFNDFDPIGLREDLEALQYSDIKEFFELQYSKPSKIINVSKNSKYSNDSIEFSDLSIDKVYVKGDYDVELELSNKFKDKSSIIITSELMTEDFGYISFINTMLSYGLASPLYQEVREKKGLVYYVSCYLSILNKQAINVISTLTSNDNVDEVNNSIKEVLTNPDKYITQDRIDVIKDYYMVRKQKSEILRYKNVNDIINDNQTVYDVLDNITLDKIKEVYQKYYSFDTYRISVDKTEFKRELV